MVFPAKLKRAAASAVLLMLPVLASAQSAPAITAADGTVCTVITPETALSRALSSVPRGGCLYLSKGVYKGPWVIAKSVDIRAETGAEIRGRGTGSTIKILASDVKLTGLTVTGFGREILSQDAGIHIRKFAHDITITGVTVTGPGFGVYAEGVSRLTVQNSVITGEKSEHVLDRGDGVYVKSTGGAVIRGNTMRYTRDGVYLESTDGCTVNDNDFAGLQYGVHFMYTKNDRALGNKSEAVIGGVAVMSSRNSVVAGNVTDRAVEFGILLNESNGCLVENNTVTRTHNPRAKSALNTEGKGLFIYGAGVNRILSNRFETSDIGIDIALGGEGSTVLGNVIDDNRTQVRYIGKRPLTWSDNGRGNYWGAGSVWDLDGDGVADAPYQPNDSLDRLFWLYPEARFLMDSPVVFLLRRIAAGLAIDSGKGITDYAALVVRPEAGARKEPEK